ncbi:NADH-quinone oxidoreductase subunit F [Rhodobacterales bacterium 52_120_T64]|nr:NADH-quinone oxidoreductase subunit F [Rhodobacterales bacterium 52_120_T64]
MAPLDQRKGVWKSGKGKGRHTPKGRQLDETAWKEIELLLGSRSRSRDLLIEHLHLIQDKYGHLSAAHLRALAEEMSLAMSEVYEVASFYAHFDIVKEGETAPPSLTIRVCDSLSCELAGAEKLLAELGEKYSAGQVRVLRAPCMGRCDTAPTLELGHNHIDHASVDLVEAAIEANDVHPHLPDYETVEEYYDKGGSNVFYEMITGKISVEHVIETVAASGLRGLGGAGFPTAKKWGFVRAERGPRYLAVNADEGEPGTFKDRYYLERQPLLFVEGMLIAARVVDAEKCFIYLRDEYPAVRKILQIEIAKLEESGVVPVGFIDLRRGAGAYICGEESAMIESIEGKRGLPRHRPPFVAQNGIFGRPTLVHNVETLIWVARVMREGPEILNGVEHNGRKGLRSYSVSGRVKEPGVKLLPAGSTITDIITASGGMLNGHTFNAYQPGGPSSGLLPASVDDVPLDFDTLQPLGTFIGSAAVIVLSDQDSIRDAALNMVRFFAAESCGQCTPCRVGCDKAVLLMQNDNWDGGLLNELSETMIDASICGLGQAAPNPILSVLKYFPDEV